MADKGERAEGTSQTQVTLAAPGLGRRWYLLELSAKSDAAYTLTVQSPALTNVLRHTMPANAGFEKSWVAGMAGAENQAMVIDVSAGSYDVNYVAVVK